MRSKVVEIPNYWLNLLPLLSDFPRPLGDMSLLQKVGIPACFEQEFSSEAIISIPGELLDLYKNPLARPRPLLRAERLEKELDTPAELWWKGEMIGSPTGSHKLNTALAQIWYAKQAGFRRVVTETGAGQWGTAVAYAGAILRMPVRIYWVRAMYDAKPERRDFIRLYGAEVFPSPSGQTECGRELLAKNSNHQGSLGIAISEGLEDASKSPGSCYVLGSVLNHVLLHQTIIGLEAYEQIKKVGRWPDYVVSCVGGGSNFGGLAIPFIYDVLTKWRQSRPATTFIGAQSQNAPNLTGVYRYDYPDHAKLAPQLLMLTLGHDKEMSPIFGDGLRYHAVAPLLSYLISHYNLIRPMLFSSDEVEIFEAAKLFFRSEGYLPAPESAYSIAAAIRLAREAKKAGQRRVILFNVSGHGYFDMAAYRKHCLTEPEIQKQGDLHEN